MQSQVHFNVLSFHITLVRYFSFMANLQFESLSATVSSCEPIQVEMCQGLSYNLTSFPNVWLSIGDQTEAAYVLHRYTVGNNTQNPACNV